MEKLRWSRRDRVSRLVDNQCAPPLLHSCDIRIKKTHRAERELLHIINDEEYTENSWLIYTVQSYMKLVVHRGQRPAPSRLLLVILSHSIFLSLSHSGRMCEHFSTQSLSCYARRRSYYIRVVWGDGWQVFLCIHTIQVRKSVEIKHSRTDEISLSLSLSLNIPWKDRPSFYCSAWVRDM